MEVIEAATIANETATIAMSNFLIDQPAFPSCLLLHLIARSIPRMSATISADQNRRLLLPTNPERVVLARTYDVT